MLELLGSGFIEVLQPVTLAWLVFGTFIGVVVAGILPGTTGSMGIILVLPITYYLPPHTALILLSGIFCGSMMGGAVTAILLNIPGTPSAGATLLDGYPLCKKGQAGKAIGIATISAFVGGTVSTIVMILIAPQLARIALQFQAADFFSLSIFGLSIMASASGKNMVKGLISGFIGLMVSTVGMDNIVGTARYTFGSFYLMGGLQMLPVLVGVFAFAQLFSDVRTPPKEVVVHEKITGIFPTFGELKGVAPAMVVGSVIGVFFGIIPGVSGVMAAFTTYNVMQKISKKGHLYGTGLLEGVAAPETANSALTGGCMVPTLTLGVPGDPITAVMLGAFVLIGIRPGPQLFSETPHIVYAVFAGWILIQFVILGMGFLTAKFTPYILRVSPRLLFPMISVLCVVGVYALSNNLFDVQVALFFGFIGYILNKYEYPPSPLILGIILGPMAEENLNRAMLNNNNNIAIFFQRPFSLVFLIIAFICVAAPIISLLWASRKKAV